MQRFKSINRRLQLQYVLPIALISILVYSPGLSNGLVADQFILFEHAMTGMESWLRFLAFSFRPFELLVYVVLHRFFGIEPVPMHLVSLAAHSVSSILVFHLARLLAGDRTKAFVAGVVFALFPRHHTAVLWSLKYPFMTLFYLLAFLAFWQFLRRRHWAWYLLSLASFLLALSNVEMAATLPILLFLGELLLGPEQRSRGWLRRRLCHSRCYVKYVPFVIVSLAWRALAPMMASAVGRRLDTELIPSDLGHLQVGVQTVSDFVGYVVYQIYPQITLRSLDINLATAVLAIGSLGLIAVLFWKGSNLERFLWLWVCIQFIPIVLFAPWGNDDKHFYLSSVGFAMILSLLLFRLHASMSRWRPTWGRAASVTVVAAWLVSSVFILGQRVEEWKVAGEMVQNILSQVKALHPEIGSDTQIYFVNLPRYHGRAYVMQPGIPSAMHIVYEDFGLKVRNSEEARINAALRSSDPRDRAVPGVLVFQYWDGKIEDRSMAYSRLKDVFDETYWYVW